MENKEPLVSVIMNCYNSDTYLKEAIESVIAQTYQNWEIIFWDNQSTDKSAKIVKSYDDERIKYFYALEHAKLGKARNLAIEKCKGEWIAFLDCDDLWDKDKLYLSVNSLFNEKNASIVSMIYSNSKIIDSNNVITAQTKKAISGEIQDAILTQGNFIIFSSIMARKDIILSAGKINENLNYCEDLDLILKLLSNNHIAIGLEQCLTSYRIHNFNLTYLREYENNIEVVEYLTTFMDTYHLKLNVRLAILMNNSYRIVSLITKLLFLHKFKQISFLFAKYPFVILLAVIAIPKKVFSGN